MISMIALFIRCRLPRRNVFKLFYTQQVNFSHKLKMNIAYFRHQSEENQFHVSFFLLNDECGIKKQFNFSRQITENCGSFVNRVAVNVEKVKTKKNKKKKNVDATDGASTVSVALLRDGKSVENEFPCKNLFLTPEQFSLSIDNQILPIKVNSPWVDSISLPKSIMAGFMVYPSKFEAFFVDRDSCIWEWYHSVVNNGKWKKCGDSEIYLTTPNDVDKYLRVVCKPGNGFGNFGPEVEAVSASKVAAGPGVLPCEARHKFTSTKMHNNGFRIVSYNILADLYVDSEYSRTVLFGYCPVYALDLNYRRQLLLKELLGYNADILCLQEVDSKVFRHDFEDLFKRHGIAGIYSPKGEAVGEGTAIFYNSLKFRLKNNWRIVLGEEIQKNPIMVDVWNKIQKNVTLAARVADRSTTLQILLLESLVKKGKLLLVANIHLYFHPDADHIRLLQAVVVAKYLENILMELRRENPDHEVSLIWCGDFNSVPECGIYQLLVTHGQVPDTHPDWRSNKEEAIENVSYETSLKMDSACGTPQFTNYTVGFKACLDYIFYEKKYFDVEQVIPLPDEEELSLNLGIPSIFFPSDHIALVSDLIWKQ